MSFFGVVAQAQSVSRIFASPATVTAGGNSELVVYLGAKASSAVTVNLSSNNSAVPLPSSVTVPTGSDYATLFFTTTGVDASTVATVTATVGGSTAGNTVTVNPAQLKTVTVSPGSVVGGNKSVVFAYLNGPAGPSGVSVSLSSSNTGAVSVPASLSVSANGMFGSATVSTAGVDSSTRVTLTGTAAGVSQTGTLQITPATLQSIAPTAPGHIGGSGAVSLHVLLLGQAGPSGTIVSLTSSCATAATVPASITIPAGASGASLPITTNAVGMNIPVSFTAQIGSGPVLQSTTLIVESGIGSSWPSSGANQAGSNAGSGSGAVGSLTWSFSMPVSVGTPVIGANGNLYLTGYKALFCLNSSGTILWSFGGDFYSSPTVGGDGTVYVTAWNGDPNNEDSGYLLAFNSKGQQKWGFTGTASGYYPNSQFSPVIGLDGTIYVVSYTAEGDAILAVNPDKSIKWASQAESISRGPSIGPDGTIYYIGSSGLVALGSNGATKWTYPLTSVLGQIAINSSGTIYVLSGFHALVAINPNGTTEWSYSDGANQVRSVAIGPDGTIYLTDIGGNYVCGLISINSGGSTNWRWSSPANNAISGPTVGSDGVIYVTTVGNSAQSPPPPYLLAFNPNGTPRWYFGNDTSLAAPIIGADGTLYMAGSANDNYSLPVIVAIH